MAVEFVIARGALWDTSSSMEPRVSMLAAPAAVAVLCLLAGCAGQDDPAPANAGGPSTGGMTPSGSGGMGSGGASSAGGSGSGGASTAGVGSGGSGDPGSAIPATFDTVKLVLGGGGPIMPCAAAPCHGVGGVAPPSKPLELPPNDDQQLYANLTSYVSDSCNDMKLVQPGDPAASALPTILRGPCGKTPRMPYNCDPQVDCIPDEYIAALEQWIAAGAPR